MSSAHDTGSARLDIHSLFDLTGDTARRTTPDARALALSHAH